MGNAVFTIIQFVYYFSILGLAANTIYHCVLKNRGAETRSKILGTIGFVSLFLGIDGFANALFLYTNSSFMPGLHGVFNLPLCIAVFFAIAGGFLAYFAIMRDSQVVIKNKRIY
jgi:hypothetical protein